MQPSISVRAAGVVIALFMAAPVQAVVTIYPGDLDGFNAAAGNPPVAIDFDDISPETDISGQTISGVTFQAIDAPLIVVRAADTFTPEGFTDAPDPESNRFPATSGENVLSPGGAELAPGPNAAVERDYLTLTFDPPVSAFGFDHLSQSADGFSYTHITVYDSEGDALYFGAIPISNFGDGGAAAGADFWGIVSDNANIAVVVITEDDADEQFPDCNIGFDTFRISASPSVSLFGWISVRTHGGLGSIGIPLDPDAFLDGVRGPTVETRNGGIRSIQVTLIGSAPANLDGTVHAVDVGSNQPIPATSATIVGGDTVVLDFAAGVLADGRCYRIDLLDHIPNLVDDTDVMIRALIGDTNGDGLVTLIDFQLAKSRIGQPVLPNNVHIDVNADGAVSLIDAQLVKTRIGRSVTCSPPA